jgi:hypothetical protein
LTFPLDWPTKETKSETLLPSGNGGFGPKTKQPVHGLQPAKNMDANEWSPPHAVGPSAGGEARPGSIEETIRSEKLQVERKTFLFNLKSNPRGCFLRITEDVGGRRDSIIIPAPGLEDFKRVLEEMVKAIPK